MYGASDGLRTVLIEKWAMGGQAGSTSCIENYLGFPDGISGAELLAERARKQAVKFGVEILLGREGVRAEFLPGKRVGHLADGTHIVSRAAICATGVEYRKLGLPNEDRFRGAGVYTGQARAKRRSRGASPSTSSAAATPRVRRRCTSRPTRAASRW